MNVYLSKEQVADIHRSLGAPEVGDEAWIWYRPVMPSHSSSLFPNHISYCGRCDVFDVQDLEQKTFKCWNCGKFLKRPSSWSSDHYKPYGPGFQSGPAPAPTPQQANLFDL